MGQSNCYSINGVDDAELFHSVKVILSFTKRLSYSSSLLISEFYFVSLSIDLKTLMLQEALDIVHVSKEDQESVFAMLAAVLWLGNVSFTVIDNENDVEPVADESKPVQSLTGDAYFI